MSNRFSIPGLALLALLGSPGVYAQSDASTSASFPSRPIRWIVPFPAGGGSDVVARIVGQPLGERLKQPVLVENRAGGAGNIGMKAVARAAPDGYTILLGTPNMVINAVLYKQDVDPIGELTAVSLLTMTPFVLLVRGDFPARTLPEILAVAKARPGAVTCGWGATVFQLACELLKIQGQVDIRSIPYKGQAPALNDLVGGQIDLLFNPTNTALPQVKAGRVRAIANASPKRGGGAFGDLPAVDETLPGFAAQGWFGVLAPAATPHEIIERLNRELAAVLDDSAVREHLVDSGLEVVHGPPEAFAEIIRSDYARYSKVIRDAGIKAE